MTPQTFPDRDPEKRHYEAANDGCNDYINQFTTKAYKLAASDPDFEIREALEMLKKHPECCAPFKEAYLSAIWWDGEQFLIISKDGKTSIPLYYELTLDDILATYRLVDKAEWLKEAQQKENEG